MKNILLCILLTPLPVLAQYKCTMPNGAVVVSRLSPCPSDAVKSIGPDGAVTYGKPNEYKPPPPKPPVVAGERPPVLPTSPSNPKQSDEKPLEYKLAMLNAGGFIQDDHITVARFRSLLSQLATTYVESRESIADMTLAGQQKLRGEGIDESLLNIMEGLNQIFVVRIENQRYAEYAAAYVTLRAAGKTHTQTIAGLRAIIQRAVTR